MSESDLDELIAMLVRLIVEGQISEADANRIIDTVRQTGRLPDGYELSLPLEEVIPEELASLVSNYLSLEVGTHYILETAQDNLEKHIDEITRQLIAGDLTLKEWQEKFRDALIEYIATAAAAGAQTDITGTERENPVLEMIRVQLAYLSRFGDERGIALVSDAQMQSRARQYSGTGRAAFYQEEGLSNADSGWIVDYIAVDDRYTCEPCRQAEEGGPYLPDDRSAPLPGSVCLGRGFCRCIRALRYDPPMFLRLSGAAA